MEASLGDGDEPNWDAAMGTADAHQDLILNGHYCAIAHLGNKSVAGFIAP